MNPPPSPAVVAAFGLDGVPIPLSGGRGSSWRVGKGVLKPTDQTPEELDWQANLLHSIEPEGFRVARVLRSSSGQLVVHGWTATSFLDGRHEPWWPEVIAVGERFHAAVARVPRPQFLDRRTGPWAIADRVAWDEAPALNQADRLLARLAATRRPLDAPRQLIHGDLTENVLFATDEPPAVIDLAPYWRPPAFASAVVIADALVWHHADPSILDAVGHVERFGQFLIRALMYRLVTDRLFHPDRPIPPVEADPYANAVELAARLAADDG